MAVEIWFSIAFASLFSALGGFLLFVSEDRYSAISPYMLSLAAGTMFGGVFIHMVFRLANQFSYGRVTGFLVVIGVIGSLLLERAVHWHCHHNTSHSEPLPYVLATGDAVHNLLDGVLIATSFLASFSTGIAALVAVIAHKIPKEFGDFGVMVEFGFSDRKALATNIGVSLFMFLGAGIVLMLSGISSETVPLLLPLVAGNFIFIAGSDLMPLFKEEPRWKSHLAVFSAGLLLMYAIPFLRSSLGV